MFSIVILDLTKNEIVFINDRLGVKPLYIYEDSEILIFASELKGILQYENIDKTIDKKPPEYNLCNMDIFNHHFQYLKVRKIEPELL